MVFCLLLVVGAGALMPKLMAHVTEGGVSHVSGAYTGFHGIYNLLITAEGPWNMAGFLFPSVLIAGLFVVRRLIPRLKASIE